MCLGPGRDPADEVRPAGAPVPRGARPPVARARCSGSCEDARTLVRALGYDMNSIEFAVRDGVPYAIDFMNPAPDMDINSLTPHYFEWVVKAHGRHGDQAGEGAEARRRRRCAGRPCSVARRRSQAGPTAGGPPPDEEVTDAVGGRDCDLPRPPEPTRSRPSRRRSSTPAPGAGTVLRRAAAAAPCCGPGSCRRSSTGSLQTGVAAHHARVRRRARGRRWPTRRFREQFRLERLGGDAARRRPRLRRARARRPGSTRSSSPSAAPSSPSTTPRRRPAPGTTTRCARLFYGLPVMRRVPRGSTTCGRCPARHGVLRRPARRLRAVARAPRRRRAIAILDWKDVPTFSEFVLFQDYFREHGHRACEIVDPRDVEYRRAAGSAPATSRSR